MSEDPDDPDTPTLLRDLLVDLRSRRTNKPDLGVPKMTGVRQRLDERSASATPPTLDLDALADRCASAFATGGDGDLTRREKREAAWCLWSTRPALAETPGGPPFLASIEKADRPALKRLATVYVRQFAPHRPLLREVGALLRRRVGVLSAPWDRLQERLRVFEPEAAPGALATAAIDARCPPHQILRDEGLSETVAKGGLSETAFADGLRKLRERQPASTEEHLALVRAWVIGADGRWAFAQHRSEIAEAVAVPLRNVASDRERDQITAFLLAELKDPRLFPANWVGAEEAKAIVTRWLTQRSLVEFLDVVDLQVRDDPVKRRQWAYRRAFWEGLFHSQGSPIQSAWVVFNPEAASNARRVAPGQRSFATFSGGADGGRSVLLLDLGACIVAEWSGNGRCHVYKKDDPACPELFRSAYTANELRRRFDQSVPETEANTHGSFKHNGSEGYVWQRRVAAHLKGVVRGLRIDDQQYRVKEAPR